MAQNYAKTSSKKVDELHVKEDITNVIVNHGYDIEFTGAKTVTIYNIPTVAENNYTRTGSDRYGVPAELDTEVTDYTLTQDKGTTYTIDRGNYNDSMMVTEVAKSLKRQVREVFIPNTDSYRLGVAAAQAVASGNVVGTAAPVDKTNAYETFLDATEVLDENEFPDTGRYAYVHNSFFKMLKQDPNFVKSGDLSQKMLVKGQVGEVDGVTIIKTSKRLPADTDLLVIHKSCLISPKKIDTHKVHEDAPGISGWLVEIRRYYDAFILSQKAGGIAIHKTA